MTQVLRHRHVPGRNQIAVLVVQRRADEQAHIISEQASEGFEDAALEIFIVFFIEYLFQCRYAERDRDPDAPYLTGDRQEMGKARLEGSAPVLLVRDVAAAANYYRDKVGFSYDHMWGDPPAFCIVGRDNYHLMLSLVDDPEHIVPHYKRVESLWNAYFWVDDARVKEIVQAVVSNARTGRIGDGKIFVLSAESGESEDL